MKIGRLNIFLIRLDGAEGREESKIRPCLIISNDKGNEAADIVTVAPITSTRHVLPTHVWIPKDQKNGLNNDSMLLIEQTRTVDKRRILKYIGKIESKELEEKIDNAIAVAFSL